MTTSSVAVVVGAGPGLGLAAAKRFGEGGFHVALMARDKSKLEAAAGDLTSKGLQATAIACDASEEASISAAFKEAKSLGPIDVLVYNASAGGAWPPPKFMDTPVDLLRSSYKLNCEGAFLCSQQVVPDMLTRGKGTIIFTGASASLRGSAGFAAFASGKFALRALAQSMARELQPQGIHVAIAIIDGIIGTPRAKQMMPSRSEDTFLSPDAIAESYWSLHSQHRSAWTQELDLRPFTEKF